MGVITLTLVTVGLLPAHSAPPLWVVVSAGLAIAAGTAMGGWRIIRTLGPTAATVGALASSIAITGTVGVFGRRARWRVEHIRADEGTLQLAVGPRLHPQWTSEAHAWPRRLVLRHPASGRRGNHG